MGLLDDSPAASMDGGVFYRAAERYGLPTDNETLNGLVRRVNRGMSIDQAAQEVKGSKGGLFGAINSDSAQLGLALLAAAGPRAQPASFGQRLAGAVGDLQQQRYQQQEREMRAREQAQREALLSMQVSQLQRQQKRQDALEALPAQFMRQGVRPAAMDNRDVGLPGEPTIPATQFDMAGYANAMFKYDPREALALQNSLRKDTTPIKVGAGETLLEPGTNRVLYENAMEPKSPSSVLEWQFARSQGYKGAYSDWVTEKARAGASSVTYGAPVAGVDAKGNPVFFQPDKSGGSPSIIPGVLPPPKETPAALKEKLASNSVTLGKISRAIELVDQNPRALGLQNYMGDAITQRTDPGGVEVRAMISDIAGQKIHDRSGAAVTVGELARLKPYIPNVTDTPSVVKQKLTLFQNEYQAMQQELNSGATIQQAGRFTGGAPAAGGWSARRIGG